MTSELKFVESRDIPLDKILHLYRENHWSSVEKPEQLHQALLHSDHLVTAWDGDLLIGLGNAITDGYLVVYYPHLLVLPGYRRRGVGRELLKRLKVKYQGFHQHILIADENAVEFYQRCGFRRAGRTEPMWIYDADDH